MHIPIAILSYDHEAHRGDEQGRARRCDVAGDQEKPYAHERQPQVCPPSVIEVEAHRHDETDHGTASVGVSVHAGAAEKEPFN